MTNVDIDRKALSWVRDEIKQALDRARQALEAFVEDNTAVAELSIINENLHQVNGTLKMIGLYGISLLTDEMSQLVDHLREDQVSETEDAHEVLMRAIVQIPIYLDNLQKGQRDIPIILLPLLNDLRALCGASLLSEAAFFNPDLNVVPSPTEARDPQKDEQALARKLRPIYQLSLIGIYRSTDVAENLKRLTKVVVQLERQAGTLPEQQVWWVCGGLTEALFESGLELSASIKHLLGAIDRRIKQLAEQGPEQSRSPLSTEVLKNTLYYLAQATSSGKRVELLNQQFALKDLLPSETELSRAKDGLLGLDGDLIQHVAGAIKEDLLHIKEALDVYARSQEKDISSFAPILDRIKTVADTLGMIGMGRQRADLLQHHASISQALGGGDPVHDNLIMGIASTLLFVESSLASEISADSDNESLLPQAEFNELIRTTAKEARSVLHHVKDAIVSYANDNSKLESLTGIPEQLRSVSGVMEILNQRRGSELFNQLCVIIEQGITSTENIPGQDTLNTLADIVTGGEYFIDAVVDDPVGVDKALDVMADGLARLGHAATAHEGTVSVQDEPADDLTLELGDAGDLGLELEAAPGETWVYSEPESNANTAAPAAQEDEDIDEEVMEIFLEEADEEATSIAQNLRAWQDDINNNEALTTLRRSFHTIKGSGRIVGATDIGEFAWAIENMLNRVIDKTIAADAGVFNVLAMARDALPQFINKLKGQGTITADVDMITSAAHDLSQGRETALGSDATDMTDSLETGLAGLESDGLTDMVSTDADLSDDSIDPILAEIFTNETLGHLETVETYIDRAMAEGVAQKVSHDLIRALHTLHGSANMAGISKMVQLTDDLEKYAKTKMDDNASVSNEFLTLLHDSTAAIRELLENLSQPGFELPNRQTLEQRARALLSEHDESPAAEADDASEEILLQGDGLADDMVWDDSPEMEVEFGLPMAEDLGQDDSGQEVDTELVGIFVEEAEEILSQMESTIQDWLAQPEDEAGPAQLRRNLHTLKGGARMAGLQELGNLAHEVESVLEKFSESPGGDRQAYLNLVQNAHDWIVGAVESIRGGDYSGKPTQLMQQVMLLTGKAAEQTAPAIDIELSETQVSAPVDPDTVELQEEQAENIFDLTDTSEIEEISLASPTDDLFADELGDANDVELITMADDDAPLFSQDGLEDIELADTTVETQPWDIETSSPSAAGGSTDAGEYDSELLDIFLEEAGEILTTTDELIQHWIADPGDQETVKQLQRALHTMKGGARMAKVTSVGNLSHSIETAMEALQESGTSDPQLLIRLVRSSYDWMADAIEKITNNIHVDTPDGLISEIEAAAGLATPEPPAQIHQTKTAPAAAPIDTTEETVEVSPQVAGADISEDAFTSILEAAAFLDDKDRPAAKPAAAKAAGTGEVIRVNTDTLENLINNAGEISIYRSRIDLQLGTITYNLVELEHTVNRIREQLRKFEIEAETQILYRFESSGAEQGDRLHFDPLELDRFSNMQQLSRSLAESVGDLSSIQKLIAGLTRETEILLVQQSRINSELQNGLMRTRLVPFSSMVPRLRRIVRQTSQELGKEVDFKISGAEGEMDRTVLNRFTPALEHILRNAIDHGVELPAVRKKNKKPAAGTIHMDIDRVGGEFVITINDDGAGMNLEAIRSKAIERGLMEKSANLSNNEIVQFVMEAGFSTATKVTQISGRGVGMDVVNTEIKQLGGSVQINTNPGAGTQLTVRLPLTVSVNQALIVLVGEGTYAIPLSSIVGVVRIGKQEAESMHNGTKSHYAYGDNEYQFFHLGTLMNICKPMEIGERDKVPMILARTGDHKVALLSEAIIGRSEVVVKTVGPQISSVQGISGATIMGDGSVALILDVPNLVRSGLAHIATGKTVESVEAAQDMARQPTILVVDDSITVRKVTERLLKRNDMIPITAKDGLDALDKLQETVPDLILSDIEMPRMDGYEFVTNVRRDARLVDIPIIMITSRTGAKHRDRAMEIGADMYMGKPFQDTELLENIGNLLRERK